MLNKGERYEVLKAIRACFQYGFFPGQVELSSWELLPLAKRQNVWKSRLSFIFVLLHEIYLIGSLARAYLLHSDTLPLHEMIIHSCLAAAGVLHILWYYILFVKYPGVLALYFKMTLKGKIGAEDIVDGESRSWSRRLQEFTPQDWYAMGLPYTFPSTVATIMLALVCYPEMKVMLYNAVPEALRTWLVFGILLLEELRFLVTLMCLAAIVWILQVISFELLNNQLQLLINSMQRTARGTHSFKNAYKSLRCMQLYTINVNLVNRFLIFSWKVFCIGVCISSGYAAIAHFSDYPVFGVMYYVLLLNSAFIYIFTYDKAFKIPVLFEKARQRALLLAPNLDPQESRIMRMQIRSIPKMGIQVGRFHTMERVSTLVFVHFVVNNIVNMLVANRVD